MSRSPSVGAASSENRTTPTDHASPGTVYTFAIGGDAKFPDVARYKLGPLISGVKYDPKDAPEGAGLYVSNCLFCHGVRASTTAATSQIWAMSTPT